MNDRNWLFSRAVGLVPPGQARRLAVCLVLVAGCAPAAAPVSLRIAGAEGYEEALGKHRGKVVLVDFWATWCAPCVEMFPHTVKLHREYQERGLAVVSVSLNAPVEAPQVQEFLVQQNAAYDNLLSKYDSGVQAIKEFGLPGSIPCFRVYDRSGALRREFAVDPRADRQYTTDDIEAAIKELL